MLKQEKKKAAAMLAVAQGQPPQASEATAGGNAKKRVKQEEERNEDDASALEKERERLVYVLSKISLEDLVGALKGVNSSMIMSPSRIFWPLTNAGACTVPILTQTAEVKCGSEGVRHLAALLPATVYPGRTLLTCLRCHKEYDPSYQSGGCKMRHPKDMVQEGEDRHWQYRCVH